jgi:hypothetical protein
MSAAAPKGWSFLSVNGVLTMGQLWEDDEMDEIRTNYGRQPKTQTLKKILFPMGEEACTATHNPQAERQAKARKRSSSEPGRCTAHHTEKRPWYLLEFKYTSDVRPDYLERKEVLFHGHPPESFMDIHQKSKGTIWTSGQLNFVVGSVEIPMTYFHPV